MSRDHNSKINIDFSYHHQHYTVIIIIAHAGPQRYYHHQFSCHRFTFSWDKRLNSCFLARSYLTELVHDQTNQRGEEEEEEEETTAATIRSPHLSTIFSPKETTS